MALDKLFYLQGVGDSFIDCSGAERRFSDAERMALLCALLGCQQPPDEASIAARIDELDAKPWCDLLPVLQYAFVDEPAIELNLPEDLVIAASHAAEHVEQSAHYSLSLRLSPLGDEAGAGKALSIQSSLVNTPIRQWHTRLFIKDAIQVGDYLRPEGRYLRLRFVLPLKLAVGEYRAELLALSAEGSAWPCEATSLPYKAAMAQLLAEPVTAELLIIPRRAYQGMLNTGTHPKPRPWGLGISLFYLRSQRQWGIGDFADLGKLIELAAGCGCDFITLTPLHAPSLGESALVSPYSPWDRRFLNPLYIAIDYLLEYGSVRQELSSADWLRERLQLNQLAQIDYSKVAQLKYRALARLFDVFELMNVSSPRVQRFEAFITRGGKALADFCQSQLLEAARLEQTESAAYWRQSPSLANALGQERFFAWLQFVADEQLEQSQLRCRQQGMRLGLVRDLAVGALGQGSEVSPPSETGADSRAFCLSLDIGAPPDPFSARGQHWGMPPFDPVALKRSAYRAFRVLCRQNMRHCGALRIDHVMAMSRIWCWSQPLTADTSASDAGPNVAYSSDVAAGATSPPTSFHSAPSQLHSASEPVAKLAEPLGCYLYFPADMLLAILTLESHLSRCVLIGEDLGTVPPELKGQLKGLGILGNDLVYFCREGEQFIAPGKHRRMALLQLGNQDVPSFIAWWRGLDLQQQQRIEHERTQFEDSSVKGSSVEASNLEASALKNAAIQTATTHESSELTHAMAVREADKQALLDALIANGSLSASEASQESAVFDALLHWCGSSRAELVGVSLWDLALETRQVNIPGTHNEYPNWRARLSLSLESLWQSTAFKARLNAIALGRCGYAPAGSPAYRIAPSAQRP